MKAKMLLSHIKSAFPDITLHGPDRDISGVRLDSRQVKPGDLFIAISGTAMDGTTYITSAIQHGAVAVLVEEGTLHALPVPLNTTFLTAPDIRSATSAVAASFYARQPETIAAVTGTSGKTSTAQFTREIWQAMGFESASIGTLGFVAAKESQYGSLTTPDSVALHKLLDSCIDKHITHIAMEASSHGLEQHRLDHVRLKAAGFTNLSRDHLDFHPTMEAYLAAKIRLFREVLPPGAAAVLNADIPEYETLAKVARNRGLRIISFGQQATDIKLLKVEPQAEGQILTISLFGKKHTVQFPVIGAFQAWNTLCALGLVIGSGGDANKAVAALPRLTGVPGRLQYIGTSAKGGTVFVDYAHKPDALENVLTALRPHVTAHPGAKLGVVFGCGGNRDKGKRPQMGEIATRLADWTIVTDDNPRHEVPTEIRREIVAGCHPGAALQEIGDRAEAIHAGIAKLGQGDVLVIAGKGHEPGQIVGDKTLPFDDADVARAALKA